MNRAYKLYGFVVGRTLLASVVSNTTISLPLRSTETSYRDNCILVLVHSRTIALGSTQPLVKMNTRNIPGGKGGRCVRLTTSPLSRAECHENWETKPPGTLWATPGLLWDSFTFTFTCKQFESMNII
jgi:hypothetical protein